MVGVWHVARRRGRHAEVVVPAAAAGDAYLTSSPFGERLWNGSSQTYYLRSFRSPTNPFVEEIRFKAGQSLSVAPWCSDMTPTYSFRVFNYLPGNTLSYTLSLPAGDEN